MYAKQTEMRIFRVNMESALMSEVLLYKARSQGSTPVTSNQGHRGHFRSRWSGQVAGSCQVTGVISGQARSQYHA